MPDSRIGIGEPRASTAGEQYLGICSTCNWAPDCVHRLKNPTLAIWQCDNHDDHIPVNRGPISASNLAATSATSPGHALRDENALPGLCGNCEKRASCLLPRPAGGLWHCEEYE